MPGLRCAPLLALYLGAVGCKPHAAAAPVSESLPATPAATVAPASTAAVLPIPVEGSVTERETSALPDSHDAGAPDSTPVAKSDAIGQALSLQANLTFVDAVVGAGREAKDGDHVSIHCVGTLQDGTVFQNSRVAKHPLLFVAGGDKVVMGLSEGIVGMRVGGRRTLTVPPALGYGRRGLGTKVPPNATLSFDVELLSVK